MFTILKKYKNLTTSEVYNFFEVNKNKLLKNTMISELDGNKITCHIRKLNRKFRLDFFEWIEHDINGFIFQIDHSIVELEIKKSEIILFNIPFNDKLHDDKILFIFNDFMDNLLKEKMIEKELLNNIEVKPTKPFKI